MVKITKEDNHFVFDVQGLHKLWAFKSSLRIPIDNIKKAYQDLDAISKWWKGWRAPGTSVPFLITAGTYHLEGNKIFWDVVNKENTIIIDLDDADYQQLIIEVENPEEAIALLSRFTII